MITHSTNASTDTVVVIGGGFSGTLCALHLAAARPDLRISIVERSARLGPGLAYGACVPEHVLNVPVNRLGIGLEPSFEAWLRDAVDPSLLWDALEESGGRLGDAFVPRALFGDYLEDLARRRSKPDQVNWLRGEAVAFLEAPRRGVLLADGRQVEATVLVLALGNQTPSPPEGAIAELQDLPEYIADPWAPGATSGVRHDDPVVIIGAGLTMVDVVLMLRQRGHTARITAVSRRGQLPRVHAFGGQWPGFAAGLLPASPASLMRSIRSQVRRAQEQGVPWQRVIDSIRPVVSQIWAGWSLTQRQQFLRHARAWWDTFRHRMPIRVADRLSALMKSGDLEVRAGRIRSYERTNGELSVKITHPRRTDAVLQPKHIVNCTGPRTDFSVLSSPIVLDARRRRLIKADQLGLGIETSDCSVISQDGYASDWLYAIGPLTRPAWWEITAVPEINAQVLALAKSFASADFRNVSVADAFRDIAGDYLI